MTTIPVPATGDPATASWAAAVANQLNQMRAFMTLANPNASTPGAGTATWVTMGNITVPAWATQARVGLTACGINPSVANAGVDIAVKIGSSTGALKRWTAVTAGARWQFALNDLLTAVPTGSQSVTVQATFANGTFSAPATVSLFDLNIDWLA